MQDTASVHERIRAILSHKLNVDPPASDVDLLATGLLDSLMFASLLVDLQESFGVNIELEKLDLDDFKSVDRIANLVVGADRCRNG
jgi:methoxymalonate biosynthesis acyl carrier protein